MDDFTLFETALDEYAKIKGDKHNDTDDDLSCLDLESEYSSGDDIEECKHANVVDENGIVCCTDCGIEMEKHIYQDKEWRYYGQSDNKRTADPNRVHLRKIEERNIFKDVEGMGFSDKIVYLANQIYLQVTNGSIFRGTSRKALIFACIFHSLKASGRPQSHEKLIQIFDLSRKAALRGLKYVNLNVPKDSVIHTTYITPIDLIRDIMDKFNASDAQRAEVCTLYEKIKNKSSRINRARPQSIACVTVWLFIMLNPKINITLKEFASKTELSELTIKKLTREACVVLNIPDPF